MAVRLDVFLSPQQIAPADVGGRVVAVIDVLRASTSIAVALANGARAVIPLDSTEEVVRRAKAFDRADVLTAGERNMLAIPGFDLGNSPREFSREAVEGKTVLLTTTTGTVALTGLQGARDAIVASYVNFSAVLALMRSALRGGTDLTIVCAGRERQFSLEDAACAGRYVREITKRLANVQLNDAARACLLIERRYRDNLTRLFLEAAHGRALAEAGFREDLAVCASLDTFPIVPIYQDRQILKLGPDREP